MHIARMQIAETEHRPWPAPRRAPFMYMDWNDLAFLHWPVPMAALSPHLPAGLELDTFDGTAWIGGVPFWMSGVRPRGVPALPWLSRFPELNVRTYVTGRDPDGGAKPGVFFLSLDAANPVAVRVARRWFHLPYFDARMEAAVESEDPDSWSVRYRSLRTHRGAPSARFEARYRATGPELATGAVDDLTRWLTERYCLYGADRKGRVHRGEVHHRVWPLQPGEAEIVADSLTEGWGIERPDVEPLVLVSRRLSVLAWSLDGPL
jgi:hypothetical protein